MDRRGNELTSLVGLRYHGCEIRVSRACGTTDVKSVSRGPAAERPAGRENYTSRADRCSGPGQELCDDVGCGITLLCGLVYSAVVLEVLPHAVDQESAAGRPVD